MPFSATRGLFRSVYIHVPFCRHRCGYCDFTLLAGQDDLIDSYLAALDLELDRIGDPVEIDTLFFGGGTPTHLSLSQLEHLFKLLQSRFSLAPGAEVSVEANPRDLNLQKVRLLADLGVNRVSLGAQSFDERALRLLERDHTPGEIDEVVARLRQAGIDSISLDLIFGVPGLSLSDWQVTLRRAIALQPDHVSTYGLTIEKGTAFWTRRHKGELVTIPEELERDQYSLAIEELSAAGFEHYELSNHARPGTRCRHNEVYWRHQPFEAFGPGAARFLDGVRQTNHRSALTWMKRLRAGQSPVADHEQLSPEQSARERLFVGLRLLAGVQREEFRQATGFDLDELAGATIAKLVACGWLDQDAKTVRLSKEGIFVADSVIAEFL